MLPTQANIFTPKSQNITDLLRDIDRHKVALPDFQRKWVWDPQMISDLLVSVAYKYPAGSLLTIPVSDGKFQLRPFEGSGKDLKEAPSLVVLDGQQRLTSLYQALHRQDGVNRNNKIYHFYLDINTLLSDDDGIEVGTPLFRQSLFFVEEKKGRRIRYQGLQPLYELSNRAQELEHGALPLSLIFQEGLSKWKNDFLIKRVIGNDLEQYQKLLDIWDQLVGVWFERIRGYSFPEVELSKEMPLAAICYIFEKVNSTGVPLSVFDLLNAILWAQGFQLNNQWDKTQIDLQKKIPMQTLNGVYFLQGISLLDGISRKRANPGGRVGVACGRDELLKLKRETVENWWGRLVIGCIEAAKFMRAQGIFSPDLLPYSPMIVPLSAIFADLWTRKGEAYIGSAWLKIEKWFWCSIFSRRYSSNIETNTAQDFEQVLTWIDGGEAPYVIQSFTFNSDTLVNAKNTRSVIFKGLLCLIVREGARDFAGGAPLTLDLYYETRQDVHHIYPTDALGEIAKQDHWADSIANKTLINASLNRSIKGAKPSVYLSRLHKQSPEINFALILGSHEINAEYLSNDQWLLFSRDRRERFRKLIEKVCGGNVLPFSDDITVEDDESE